MNYQAVCKSHHLFETITNNSGVRMLNYMLQQYRPGKKIQKPGRDNSTSFFPAILSCIIASLSFNLSDMPIHHVLV